MVQLHCGFPALLDASIVLAVPAGAQVIELTADSHISLQSANANPNYGALSLRETTIWSVR